MATSLNGWPAISSGSSSQLKTIAIPNTRRKVTLQKDAAPLFASFLSDWQQEMPDRMSLNPGPTDGWNYRSSRMTSGLSNHSSGTAVDVLYSSVLPADGRGHMTAKEKEILDDILSRYVTKDGHRVLANGEWWDLPHRDGMHTELSQDWDRGAKRNTSLRDVREVIARMGIRSDGTKGFWDGQDPNYDAVVESMISKQPNPSVWRLACKLADMGYYEGKPVRGVQKYPLEAVKAWQKDKGYAVTGIYSPSIHRKLFG